MKLRNKIKYLPAFVFCVFIFAFMILYFVLPKRSYSPQEKKNLASMPELTWESLDSGKFQKGLDSFLSDHIPGRNFFAGLSADYELAIGQNGSKGIYLGSDGYLFPKPATDSANLLQNAEYISEFAESVELPVYMTVIPSTGYINSSRLPLVHEEYRDAELISDFSAKLGESVKFLDVTDRFRELSSDNQLYYRTDHHWTARGAYECYCALGNVMGYSPVGEGSFEKETVEGFYGTSYSKSALWSISPDSLELWSNKSQPEGSVSVEISDGEQRKSGTSYFFREQLENDDKYPVYLDGNHSLVRIKNSSASGGKLILVKDSYGHSIAPFLSQNYSEIIMVDLRYYKKEISALADEENADAVLLLYSLDNLAEDKNLAYLF